MSLQDLLPQNQKGDNKKNKTSKGRSQSGPGRRIEKEEPQMVLTVRTAESTKELLLRIQNIKKIIDKDKGPSQGDLVREGLELLAKKIQLEEKEKEYAKFLKEIR